MTVLQPSTLSALASAVERPAYDRGALRTGIVHLGLGGFHRAHQALYTQAAIAAGDLRWGIVGVSLRSRAVAELMNRQDCLYSVTERHGPQATSRLVGAVQAALHAPSELERVLAAIAEPGVAILTSTVTEKGYSQNPATSDLDVEDADIRHDLATRAARAARSA